MKYVKPVRYKYLYCLLTLAGLSAMSAHAQVVVLKGGMSFPSGSYANVNATRPDNGFASTGGFGALGLSYPVYKKLSVCVEAGFSSHGFQEQRLAEQLTTQSATATINMKEGYRANYTLAGIALSFPKNKFDFSVKVLAGFMNLKTPEYTTTYNYPTNQGTVYTSSQSDMGFAISWGVEIGYNVWRNFNVVLALDNINASMQYKKSYTSSNQEYSDMNFQAYQLGAGIGYRF